MFGFYIGNYKVRIQSNTTRKIIEMLQIQASEGVEFSVSTATNAIGVLVPIIEQCYALEFIDFWCSLSGETLGSKSEEINALAPRFIRCDILSDCWQALTLYGEMLPSYKLTNEQFLTNMPVFGHAIRFERAKRYKTIAYISVKGIRQSKLNININSIANQLEFSQIALSRLEIIQEQVNRLGWFQYLAFTKSPSVLKLDVSTHHLSKTVWIIRQWDAAGSKRVCQSMQKLGGALGYIGATINSAGYVSWRAYARAFDCCDIEQMVLRLLL
jgi:hypothetical protein